MSAVSDLRPDAQAVLLLVLLYTLQGVPMGLGAAVSFMLQERGADYSQQAIFSLVSWPFSLKLLWAPVVDTVCLPAAGLRRSWIVPLQTIIGIAMFATADYSQNLLHGGVEQAVKPMTALYFVMHFLCATQDVAVDGWALTLLSAKNVGYAGTINAVGQTIGYFAAFTGFLALEQAKLMSLGSFMLLCGALFLVSAAWVAVSPESRQVADKEDPEAARKRAAAAAAAPLAALASSYKEMLSIARLPPVRTLALFLILNRIGFAATDSLTALEMMKRGVSKTTLATISACITPISIVMPVVVGHPSDDNEPRSRVPHLCTASQGCGRSRANASHANVLRGSHDPAWPILRTLDRAVCRSNVLLQHGEQRRGNRRHLHDDAEHDVKPRV